MFRDGEYRTRGTRAALFAVLCAAIVQAPALGHFFRADDFLHLYQIVNLGYLQFALNPHGGHLLFTSNSVFYFCHALFGLHAEWYYLLALLTHLLNVYLLYRVIEVSSRRPGLALIASLLWGMSAVNQEPVGWCSVYGHVLVASFVLWFLLDLARLERSEGEPSWPTLLRWYVLLLAAATSWGTGLAVAALSGGVAYLLLPDSTRRRAAALWLSTLLFLVPGLYVTSNWAYGYLTGDAAGAALAPRLALLRPASLTPALSMLGKVVPFGISSPLLGPFIARGPLAGPLADVVMKVSYAVGAAALALVLAAMFRASVRTRQRLAAYLILVLGCYAIVATGRGGFYQFLGFPMSTAAMVPRYHYVGAALVAVLLTRAAAELSVPCGYATRALAVAALAFTGGFDMAASRAINARLPTPMAYEEYRIAISAIEAAIESRPPGSDVHIQNQPFNVGFGNDAFPGWAGLFVITFDQNEVDSRRVYFWEADPQRLDAARRLTGTRISELLIAPGARAAPQRAGPLPGARLDLGSGWRHKLGDGQNQELDVTDGRRSNGATNAYLHNITNVSTGSSEPSPCFAGGATSRARPTAQLTMRQSGPYAHARRIRRLC